jgi:hypothetical protein
MKCGRSNCEDFRSKKCGGCLEEWYCGPECQKQDWNIHKIMCVSMKNLLPLPEVKKGISRLKEKAKLTKGTENEIPEVKKGISRLKEKAKLNKGTENEIRILVYCLSFIERQYGDKIVGKPYRKRNDASGLCVYN